MSANTLLSPPVALRRNPQRRLYTACVAGSSAPASPSALSSNSVSIGTISIPFLVWVPTERPAHRLRVNPTGGETQVALPLAGVRIATTNIRHGQPLHQCREVSHLLEFF